MMSKCAPSASSLLGVVWEESKSARDDSCRRGGGGRTLERMTIRPAKAGDVGHVLPMVDKVCALHESWDPAKYSFKDQPGAMYQRWLTARANDPRSVFLVAEADGNIVGFLVGTVENEIPIYRLEEFGFIHDLWVE